MPASISLSHLGWSAPDGRTVLSDLEFSFQQERTGIVGRNGVGKSTLLKLIAGDLQPTTGRIALNGTIGMLRQIVQFSREETIAHLFGVTEGLAFLRKADAGDASMEDLAEIDWTLENRIEAALADVGLSATADTPLVALSGGQRTRAALATAIFADPDFLLLDEPTNNLDREGRQAVGELLQGWRKGAIIVSHDRELLDHMDAIVELTSLGATRYGGNWGQYQERKAIELAAAQQDLATAERRMTQVNRQAQITAERKDRRDATGARRGAKGDMPRILIGARKQRAENSGGGNVRLADRQRAEAKQAIGQAKAQVKVIEPLSVSLASSGLSSSRIVLRLDHISAGYAVDRPIVKDVSLSIVGPERVALTGANGSGKSTLLHVITGRLAPYSGQVELNVAFALFDQRVTFLDADHSVAENFARLNAGLDNNACRAALARFRFRADAADQQVGDLSGGQMLRAGLACVLGGLAPPPFLILDEPTNHLDLESLTAVEAGLSAYDGALLVVSHDCAFLDGIGITRRIAL
jgi:ATPase subunit of ABC transporter with duplicated ATPase domains